MYEELRIVGPPGCGKTTELARLARKATGEYGDENVMICSLTRTAAAQVAGQDTPIPPHRIGTLHAFAYHALGEPQIADDKKFLKQWNERVRNAGKSFFEITSTAGDADESGSENSWGGDTYGDRCYGAYQVARARLLPPESLDPLTQSFVAEWEAFKRETETWDFTDLLERAWEYCDTAPGSPAVIMADETQDLSRLALRLLRKWAERAEWLVTVGDPLQCLFAWAGTDADAFITPDIAADHKRTLAQSYRVPAAVHEFALRWIDPLKRATEERFGKPIEYLPRREVLGKRDDGSLVLGEPVPGTVRYCPAHFKYPEPAVDLAEAYLAQGKTVMFLAACSHMLEPLIAVLRKRGLPFHNPWRRKRGDWNPLAPRKGISSPDRILAYLQPRHTGALWTGEGLWKWIAVCEAKGLLQHGAKARIEAAGRAEAAGVPRTAGELTNLFEVTALFEAMRESSAGHLAWFEDHLLASRRRSLEYPLTVVRKHGEAALQETPRLVVGTGHSLKGSEADVAVVFPDLSAAGMQEWCAPGEGHDGILRLFYVACTRPRETLVVCSQATPLAVPL